MSIYNHAADGPIHNLQKQFHFLNVTHTIKYVLKMQGMGIIGNYIPQWFNPKKLPSNPVS